MPALENRGITLNQALLALKAKDADRDFIVISHPISRDLHYALTQQLKGHEMRQACTVFLTTYGGDPHAGFRVARCLRHYYREVRLAVPSFCKSAGTLIAIGASELAIGDLGELGPLDVQVIKPSEVHERSSGLDYMQALQVGLAHASQAFSTFMDVRRGGVRLPTKIAAEIATGMATGVVAPLYAQIDPNRIGEMQRAIAIALEYGKRLDKYSENLKAGSLDLLVAEYPSHSFVIDRKEARELFLRVDAMTVEECQLADSLWTLLKDQSSLCILLDDPIPEPPENHDVAEPHAAAPETDPATGSTK